MGEKFTLGVRRIEALINQLDQKQKKEIFEKCPGVSDEDILKEIYKHYPSVKKAMDLLEKHGFKVQYSRYDDKSLFAKTFKSLRKDDSEIRRAVEKKYSDRKDRLWLADTLEDVQKIMSEE